MMAVASTLGLRGTWEKGIRGSGRQVLTLGWTGPRSVMRMMAGGVQGTSTFSIRAHPGILHVAPARCDCRPCQGEASAAWVGGDHTRTTERSRRGCRGLGWKRPHPLAPLPPSLPFGYFLWPQGYRPFLNVCPWGGHTRFAHQVLPPLMKGDARFAHLLGLRWQARRVRRANVLCKLSITTNK